MPKEVFGRDFQFLAASELLTFEEITRLARIFVGARRGEDPPDRRRAAGAPRPRAARRACSPDIPGLHDLTLTTNGSLLRKKAQALKAAGLAAHHRQPRLARRRRLPAHERCRLPGRAGAGGIDAAADGGPLADQDQHGRQARRERRQRSWTWRAISTAPATSCASSSTWTWAHTNGWRMDDVVPARRDRANGSTPTCRSSRSTPNYRGEVAERWRYLRWRRRDRRHRLGHAAVLRRLHPRPALAEGELYTCLFGARGHDFRALLRGGAADEEISGLPRARSGAPRRPLLRNPLRRTPTRLPQGGDVAHRRLDGFWILDFWILD